MEKEGKIKTGLRVTPEVHRRMEKLAEKKRWSLSRLAEVAVDYYLKISKA